MQSLKRQRTTHGELSCGTTTLHGERIPGQCTLVELEQRRVVPRECGALCAAVVEASDGGGDLSSVMARFSCSCARRSVK